MAQTTPLPVNPAVDPLDNYAQNIIKQYHLKLEIAVSLAISGQLQTPVTPPALSFNADKYLRATDEPIIRCPPDLPVGIIGGGIGGLYAAMLLQDQGIPYEILEASDHIGGRLFTYRFSEEKYDYYDVGAMRFPDTPIMKPVFDLFRLLKEHEDLELLKYYFKDRYSNSTLFFNDIVRQRSDVPILPKDFRITGVPARPWGELGVDANVSNVVQPFKDRLIEDVETGGSDGWQLMMDYDVWSSRAYMAGTRGDYRPYLDRLRLMPYLLGVVHWCETFDGSTSSYDGALTENVLDSMAFQYNDKPFDWYCVDGGSSEISSRLNSYLSKRPGYHEPVLNARVISIRATSAKDKVDVLLSNGKSRSYAHVITTTTLPCLRTMDLSGAALNYRQKAALRSLQYGSATKIGVKFKSAWWQNDALMRRYGAFGAIIGGQSYTDYMSRMVVYPSYGVDTDTPSTVLIASYSWTKDALAWTGLMGGDADAKHAIKRIILQDLVAVHRFNAEGAAFLEDQWVDMFPHSWVTDPNTMGAYASFGPGDFKDLYEYLTSPAAHGRLHFAGEVMSVRHAWVVGALEASKRAVDQIINSSYPDKRGAFETKWGHAEAWTRETLLKQIAVTLDGVYGEYPPDESAP